MSNSARTISLQVLSTVVVLVWLTVTAVAQSEPIVWANGVPLPVARGEAAVSEANGTVYLFGGKGPGGASVIYFDSQLGTWKDASPLDTAREAPGVAPVVGTGMFLVYGGRDGDPLNTSVLWNPGVDNPISEANLATGRWRAGYAVDGSGTIYVIGGQDFNGKALSSVETITPSLHAWGKATSLPAALYGLAAVYDPNGNIYVFGGTNGTTVSAHVYKYSLSTKAWTTLAPLPLGVKNPGAALASNGKIYVVGGVNGSGATVRTVQRYDPTTNAWAYDASLPVALSNVAIASDTQGRLMVIGGINSSSLLVSTVYVSQFLNQPDAAPVFTSTPAKSVTEGTPYTYQVALTANPPAKLTLSNPPAGMTISSSGLVSWTPTLAQAGAHAVAVVAKNRAGSTTQSFTVNVNYPPPTVPTGLKVASYAGGAINLSWNPATTLGPGPVTYNLAKRTCVCGRSSCSCKWGTVATGLTSPLATYTGTPEKSYTLAVSSTAGGMTSALCSAVTASIPGPNPVTNLAQKSATSTTVTLSWTAPAKGSDPIINYDIYEISGYSSVFLASTTSSTGVTLTGLTRATSYSVYVVAYDAYKLGAGSPAITITTTK